MSNSSPNLKIVFWVELTSIIQWSQRWPPFFHTVPLQLLINKMADEEPVNGTSDENSEKSQQKKQAKYDSGAADLEKVTDYAEEKEISTQDVANAISAIGDRRNQAALEKQAREKELLKVSIRKEDVDLIVREMEISRIKAERTLRENHGNVVNALISLTN